MIHTSLEAIVQPEKWKDLKRAYAEIDKATVPEAVLSSHLVQDHNQPKLWRIVAFWKSWKDLETYQMSGGLTLYVAVFQTAESKKPKLSVSEVIITR